MGNVVEASKRHLNACKIEHFPSFFKKLSTCTCIHKNMLIVYDIKLIVIVW